jgi:hypothetical protein
LKAFLALSGVNQQKAINHENIHSNYLYLDLGVRNSESSRPGEGRSRTLQGDPEQPAGARYGCPHEAG